MSTDDITTALLADYRTSRDRVRREPDEVLAERRTVRRFASTPVRRPSLDQILAAADRADQRLFAEDREACGRLDVILIARDVTDVDPGVYRVTPAWEPLGTLAESSWRALHVEPETHTAPAFVAVAGDLEAADRAYGSYGHVRMLRRAGAFCHAAWLAALAEGLAGGLFGAPRPNGDFRRVARLDPLRRRPCLAFIVGHPPEGSPSR